MFNNRLQAIKHRTGELEDRAIRNFEVPMKKKMEKKIGKIIKGMWNSERSNISVNGFSEGEEKTSTTKKTDYHPQIQKAQKSPSRINTKKIISKYILGRLPKHLQISKKFLGKQAGKKIKTNKNYTKRHIQKHYQ